MMHEMGRALVTKVNKYLKELALNWLIMGLIQFSLELHDEMKKFVP